MARPTIAELEAILRSGEDIPLEVLPNGEVRTKETEIVKCPKCQATLSLRVLAE